MPKITQSRLKLSGREFTLSYGMEEFKDLSEEFKTDIFKGSHWLQAFSMDTMETVLCILLQREHPITIEELSPLWGPNDLGAISKAITDLMEEPPGPLVQTDSEPSAESTSG